MADLNAPNVYIQVRITEETSKGTFNDALYFSPDEYAGLKDQQVADARQSRIDNWLDFLDNQKNVVAGVPTKEELLKIKTDLEAQIAVVDEKLSK